MLEDRIVVLSLRCGNSLLVSTRSPVTSHMSSPYEQANSLLQATGLLSWDLVVCVADRNPPSSPDRCQPRFGICLLQPCGAGLSERPSRDRVSLIQPKLPGVGS